MSVNIEPYYCPDAQIDVILTKDKFHLDSSGNYLVIGFSGVDGIEFQIKNNSTDLTVFAFYPIDEEHIEIAKTPIELVKKWKDGSIVL